MMPSRAAKSNLLPGGHLGVPRLPLARRRCL